MVDLKSEDGQSKGTHQPHVSLAGEPALGLDLRVFPHVPEKDVRIE